MRTMLLLICNAALGRGDDTDRKFLRKMLKIDVLITDDWATSEVNGTLQRYLLELFDDRYQSRSTIATSQVPVEQWHDTMEDPTLADAILDQLVHNAHQSHSRVNPCAKHTSCGASTLRPGMTHTHVCKGRFRAPDARCRVARLKPELVAPWIGIGSQRCCWRKWENVVAHMSKEDKLIYRARLQKAYQIPDYRDAKAELLSIKDDLEASNQLKP